VRTQAVLITGGLTGISRATAVAFAKEGARVVACGRREAVGKALEAELRSLGAEARPAVSTATAQWRSSSPAMQASSRSVATSRRTPICRTG
jgi:NAD(P)-dependent dehydrogenase (short-subunit alcohol dehydrogenase family)